MVRYLEAYTGQPITDPRIWKGAFLAEHYLPAASRAALYEALALLPGAEIEKGVTDAKGRQGIGVGPAFRGHTGQKQQFIFDAQTYELLATRVVEANGRVDFETTQLNLAIVDKVGQLP